MFLCGMRECSSTGPTEVTKTWFEKGHLHTCQWPLLLAAPLHPCVCVGALLGLLLSGFLVVHTRHHHQQSLSCSHHLTHQHLLPLLSSPLFFSSPPLSAGY